LRRRTERAKPHRHGVRTLRTPRAHRGFVSRKTSSLSSLPDRVCAPGTKSTADRDPEEHVALNARKKLHMGSGPVRGIPSWMSPRTQPVRMGGTRPTVGEKSQPTLVEPPAVSRVEGREMGRKKNRNAIVDKTKRKRDLRTCAHRCTARDLR
jgi:hypothetical protein